MTGTAEDNWVRVRAECTPSGFLRKLRAEICQDVLEANKQFEPGKSFSLSAENEASFLRVFRQPKDAEKSDAFVTFKPEGDTSIAVSLHRRNGDGGDEYSEQPLGTVGLEWDHERHRCQITRDSYIISTLDLRRDTLGKLFFG